MRLWVKIRTANSTLEKETEDYIYLYVDNCMVENVTILRLLSEFRDMCMYVL